MEEIKVGEYVRSRQGYIAKVIKIEEDYCIEFNKSIMRRYGEESDMLFLNPEYTYEDERSEIIKHSPNIIDLIEVGDYVNGVKIEEFETEVNTVTKNKRIVAKYEWGKVINDFEIKEIVTKEQFEAIKYTVGE